MKLRTFIITIIAIIAIISISLLFGKIRLNKMFNREVAQLFSESKPISGKTFHYADLDSLPVPVQRYFKHVLKDGQRYISYARIRHDGLFKTGLKSKWIKIEGEQYATTGKPGFIWKGTTSMFTARDMFIGDKGRLVVSLFSLFTVADARGAQYDQGELLRWLGESVLYPTNLLPAHNLQWSPINSQSSKLLFNVNGLSLQFIVSFNEAGEITRMETERYMDKTKLAPWIINCTGYKGMNNVIIPTDFEVTWRLDQSNFSYAKFHIRQVEYDRPERFPN